MIVFKAYLKILKKNLGMLLFYTMLMVTFAGLTINTSDNTKSFKAEKPNIVIINKDKEEGITKEFIKYLKANTEIKDLEEDILNDAIFYHEVSYVIYIPENFRQDFINNKDVKVEVRSGNDSDASIAEILVDNYLNKAYKYRDIYHNENLVINKLANYKNPSTKVKIKNTKNVSKLEKMSYYFSYANYPIIAGIIYAMCLIIASFNEIKIKRRNVVSSMDYKKFSKDLMLSNFAFTSFMFIIYIILAVILNGSVVFSSNGLLHILNMLVFVISTVCMSFLITSFIINKNAINGIIQVIALGTSFLCGAFVPMEILPKSVITIGHIFPSHYYIKNNDLIKTLDVLKFNDIKPILINMIIILGFSLLFVMVSIIVNKKKRVD